MAGPSRARKVGRTARSSWWAVVGVSRQPQVVAIPLYLGLMALELVEVRRERKEQERTGVPARMLGYERRDTATSLTMGIGSLVVGALLMWLELRPMDILRGVQAFFDRIYALGFGAVKELASYVLAGAVFVVPAWFVLRIMNMGGRR